MIRIRTTIGDKRVLTLFHSGKWVTLVTDNQHKDADSLAEAGRNHLQAAYDLREKLFPAKDWKERFDRDGFVDDDMGCRDGD